MYICPWNPLTTPTPKSYPQNHTPNTFTKQSLVHTPNSNLYLVLVYYNRIVTCHLKYSTTRCTKKMEKRKQHAPTHTCIDNITSFLVIDKLFINNSTVLIHCFICREDKCIA